MCTQPCELKTFWRYILLDVKIYVALQLFLKKREPWKTVAQIL